LSVEKSNTKIMKSFLYELIENLKLKTYSKIYKKTKINVEYKNIRKIITNELIMKEIKKIYF